MAKQDQLEKLRENLKGRLSYLFQYAFGVPVRVLQHRLDILDTMGDLPPDVSDKGGTNMGTKVEFLIKLENVVRDIIDLGNSDEDLMMLAFNGKTVAIVVNMFPNHQILMLIRVSGRGKQRLIDILA